MGRLSSMFPTADAVDAALKRANKAEVDITNLQEQINNIVAEASESGDVSYEVAQARIGTNGTNYDTLKERLDVENLKNIACLDTLSEFNNSPFNEGNSGYIMPMIKVGMVSPQTGEVTPLTTRAHSDLVDISGKETYLKIKLKSYTLFEMGIACYSTDGSHLGNVGYFTVDSGYSSLVSGTKKIRFVFKKTDDTDMTASDIAWLNANAFIQYGRYMPDTALKFHYSTKVGGGNTNEKYAFLGFSTSDKSSVTLNPTGNIENLGVVFKDKRYLDSISNYSIDLTNCGTNDNKLIYLDPVLKKFYVCDGLAPENYKELIDNCAFVGFVCILVPSISITSMQMSVDGNNINPYYGEYDLHFAELDNKSNIFSEFHYSIGADNLNCIDSVPLLEFTSSNKASVSLSTRMDRFTICVGGKTYGIKLSDITLDTSGLSTGDNKLVYLDFNTKTLYVFDGTNPSTDTAKSSGFLFLGLVCIPFPEVSMCKMQMSIDGRNLMMSRGAELASVRFQNKSFSVMGDSISRFDGSWGGQPAGTTGWGGDTYKNAGYSASSMWWYRLATATGMTINTINANAGSCCSTGNPSRVAGCSDARTSALDNGTNPDYILCEMGTNDFLYGVDLGSYDGTTDVPSDVSTFMGAYANMLKKIQTNYPFAKIYCCTIHQNIHDSYKTLSENLPVIVNRDNISLRDYNNAIREIAKLFGCGVIDFESCGLNIRNVADLTFDNEGAMHLHPTDVGQNMLGEAAISVYR